MKYFGKTLSTIFRLHEVLPKNYPLYADYMKYFWKNYLLYSDYMKYFGKELTNIFRLHEVLLKKLSSIFRLHEVVRKKIIHYIPITWSTSENIHYIPITWSTSNFVRNFVVKIFKIPCSPSSRAVRCWRRPNLIYGPKLISTLCFVI